MKRSRFASFRRERTTSLIVPKSRLQPIESLRFNTVIKLGNETTCSKNHLSNT